MRLSPYATLVGSLVLTGAALAWEEPWAMADSLEGIGAVPAGFWQGNWQLWRDDPRLGSRGAAALLRLHLLHDEGDARVELQFIAERAICPDPEGPPCEWLGAVGAATAEVVADGLKAELAISADVDDPFTLWLDPQGRGTLESRRGGWRYALWAEREPD
jgi:hypothetical protein